LAFFAAVAFAANVVEILTGVARPIGEALQSRRVRKRVAKVVERVSSRFVDEHPEMADVLSGSSRAVANELAGLTGSGLPADPTGLADEWAATGPVSPRDAHQYAGEYVGALHAELLKIDGFRELFVAGSAVETAQAVRRIADGEQARLEREVAASYYAAADECFHAALAWLHGHEYVAEGHAYDARSLVGKAELVDDWRVLETCKDLRMSFDDLVAERCEEVRVACVSGERAEADAARRALEQGIEEFKALVRERLL
jgi:hypothetical protein